MQSFNQKEVVPMSMDLIQYSQIFTNMYTSNDERDIAEMILEMECEEDAELQPVQSVLSK